MINSDSKSIWLCLAWIVAGCLPGAILIRESLWVDELHSAWVVKGTWQQFLDRVGEGNQQPAYFALLKLWSEFWGTDTGFAFRLLSLLAWAVAMLFTYRACREIHVSSSRHWLVSLLVASGVWFDRTNHFYSVEARPYSLIVALSAISIWSTIKLTQLRRPLLPTQVDVGLSKPDREPQVVDKIPTHVRVAWYSSLAVMVWLHITAFFVVAAAAAARVVLSRDSRRFSDSAVILTIAMIPISIQLFSNSFEQRHLWHSFAGGKTVWQMMTLLPFVTWFVLPVAGALVSLSFGKFSFQSPLLASELDVESRKETSSIFLAVGLFALIPLIGCWLVTVSGVGALMHSRYLIGAYPALLVCAFVGLCSIDKRILVATVSCLGLTFLLFSQSSYKIWQNGEIFGWQRQENWHAAIRFVQRHTSDSDKVYFSSQLIEASDLKLRSDAYYRFPIESIYECRFSKPAVLVSNDLRELRQAITSSNCGGWLLARMRREKLEIRLEEMGVTARDIVSFGNLQVVQI